MGQLLGLCGEVRSPFLCLAVRETSEAICLLQLSFQHNSQMPTWRSWLELIRSAALSKAKSSFGRKARTGRISGTKMARLLREIRVAFLLSVMWLNSCAHITNV